MISVGSAVIGDAGDLSDVAWAKPLNSRDKVNEAARAVLAFDATNVLDLDKYREYEDALEVVDNWRASHNYPLNTFQVTLRNYAREISVPGRFPPLIAQRTKRLKSIELKLRLQPTMKLTQMQDLGGARAVVRSIIEVRKLARKYALSNLKHELASLDDYIESPRESGYRGIHLVYRYFSDKQKTEYNGLKIELQLRSQFQHAWATAVETVGMFTSQALKSSIGSPDWLRFFQLMGSAIAIREGTTAVPGTSADSTLLREQIKKFARKLDVARKLNTFRTVLKVFGESAEDVKNARLYLLNLDATRDQLTITGFKQNERQRATEAYLEAEKNVRANPTTDAVLVSVDSKKALKRAYQNYFADTRLFLHLLNRMMSAPRTPRRRLANPRSNAKSAV